MDSSPLEHEYGPQVKIMGDDAVTPEAIAQTVAVALDREFHSESIPRVMASGRGFVADQILNLAFEHGIKVRQDADLAEILSIVDLEAEIPPEAFAAVAEILAYVYKANGLKVDSEAIFQKPLDWACSRGETP